MKYYLTIAAMVFVAACAPSRGPVAPAPSTARPVEPPAPMPVSTSSKLPIVPLVEGPLNIKVVYPPENAGVPPIDSNFILGSVGNGRARLWINGEAVAVYPNGSFLAWLPNPRESANYNLMAVVGSDTTRAQHAIKIIRPDTSPAKPVESRVLTTPEWVMLDVPDSDKRTYSDTDQVAIGRPEPGGDYRWFLFPQTPVRAVEYRGGYARVMFDAEQYAWFEKKYIAPVNASFIAPRPATFTPDNFTIIPAAQWIDLNINLSSRVPFLVQEGDRQITLTLYGLTISESEKLAFDNDDYLRSAVIKKAQGRTQVVFNLNENVYGYLSLWRNGIMTLRLRKPPVIDPSAPLRGLTIAVDAGHPPGGANGPTGLWEPQATLPVAQRVQRMLIERGAKVVMTRTEPGAVELYLRPVIARRENVHALVSIHFNALPDGLNPFRHNGTETYYFQRHSKKLADLVHSELLKNMGLKDQKSLYKNLALARPTWFPAILAEGAYIIMPDQEAAIRTPEYQEAYARALVVGLERYFADR